jgi:hypothetical protein
MKWNKVKFFSRISKSKIERATLWVLAMGLFVGVTLNVAKIAVRDYRELQHEIHQSAEARTRISDSTEQ